MNRQISPKLDRAFKSVFEILAILMSLYHLVAVIHPFFSSELNSNIHLCFSLVLVFLSSCMKRKKKPFCIVDLLFIAAAIVCAVYVHVNYMRFITKVGMVNQTDKIIGVILLVVVFEGSRRTFGNVLPALVILFLLYARYGAILPGFLNHSGFKWVRIVSTMTTNMTGIYGSILDISATYLVIFMIFGGMLEASGAGQFFINLALTLGGRMRSGPAQAAILSSLLVGSINGSAVANVATTGVFTIPLMKKCGYENHMAGAVEADASTGGMIMPPVMGVGAFVMAGITGIPYPKIALAALIPALLYYASLSITAQLHAMKHQFQPVNKEDIPSLKETMKQGGHFLIPMIVIIVTLLRGYSVMRCGFWGIVSVVAVVALRGTIDNPRFLLTKDFWRFVKTGLVSGAKSTMKVAPSCAIMGVLSQAIIMSNLATKIVFFIRNLSGGMSIIAVILTAIICIFFGMGVPTTASYALVAVIGAAALVDVGFSLLSVHMFIYYYAILANITPPVCPAALVGSQIADANYNKTGLTAVRIGLPGFILPFLFMYHPELLMQGEPVSVIWTAITALLGIFAMAVMFEGYLLKKTSVPQRIMALFACVTLVYPEVYSDFLGLAILAALILWQRTETQKTPAAAA